MLNKFKESPIRSSLYYVATAMLIFSIITDNPITTIKGLWIILTSTSALITDYMSIASLSSAFLNASLIAFLMLKMFDLSKIRYNGTSIASFFLMSGFALFGKNIFNIIPVFIGVYIYAYSNQDAFRKYIYTALFGTSIAPVVSEIVVSFSGEGITLQSFVVGTIVGIVCGFFLPSISTECLRILEGFNLYNTGFAAGLIGILFTSTTSALGFGSSMNLVWVTGQNPILCIFLYFLFFSFIALGYFLNDKKFKDYSKVFRHSGRAVADFTVMDGVENTFVNVGVVGAFALSYIIVLGGDVNGPTVGAIFTIAGFGALGKHLRNMTPPMLGVLVMSFVSDWSMTDPSVQLASLFCTGLAPIAGQFGVGWGMLAGAMHSVIVLNVTSFQGGLNLYNNGFAAGIVVLIIMPVIESLKKDI